MVVLVTLNPKPGGVRIKRRRDARGRRQGCSTPPPVSADWSFARVSFRGINKQSSVSLHYRISVRELQGGMIIKYFLV